MNQPLKKDFSKITLEDMYPTLVVETEAADGHQGKLDLCTTNFCNELIQPTSFFISRPAGSEL